MTEIDLDPEAGAPARVRPFSTRVTQLCLALWVAIVALDKVGQALTDSALTFRNPVEVAVTTSEAPLELLEGVGAVGVPLGPLAGETSALRADAVDVLALARERLEDLGGQGSADADDLFELRVRQAVLERDGGADEPRFAELEGATPEQLAGPLVEAGAVAFDGASTERAEACIEAALGLREGLARTLLLENLGDALDDDPRLQREVDDARAGYADRAGRLALLVIVIGLLGLVGLATVGALAFLPSRTLRLDPQQAPNRWADWNSGIGLFARYAAGLLLIQTALAATLGTDLALGWIGLASSMPLAIYMLRHYRDPHLRRSELGLGLERSRLVFLPPLALGGWVMAGAMLIAISVVGGTSNDPFTNPILDLLADDDPSLGLRLLVDACLWAPLFEELGFRAALFGGLRSRMGFLPAALISSTVFGVAHAYDPVGTAAIVGVGFAPAVLYERTRSIQACMLAHAVFNFFQLQFAFTLFG